MIAFLLLSAAIAVAGGLFVYLNYAFTRRAYLADFQDQCDTYERVFRAQVENATSHLLFIAGQFAEDPRVQGLLLQAGRAVESEGGGAGAERAADIRQALYRQVVGQWDKAVENLHARQLHFHLGPGALSFLRVHHPEKYGDRLDDLRFLIVDVNTERRRLSGFETGRVHSGLRAAVPVWADDPASGRRLHVGVLEAGTSLANILQAMDKHLGVGAAVLLKQEHVAATVWPDLRRHRYGAGFVGCDCVLDEATRPGIETLIPLAVQQGGPIGLRAGFRFVEQDTTTQVMFVQPLRDYRGSKDASREPVGAVLLWRDITAGAQAFRREQAFNLGYAVLAYLLIEILLLFVFRAVVRHMQQRIDNATSRLNEAQGIAHIGNWELDHRSHELWWSDEIYRIFEIDASAFGASYEAFLDLIHPQDRARVDRAYRESVEQRKAYEIIHRLRFPDGRIKYVQERGITVYGPSGSPQRSVGTVHDISQHMAADRAREESEGRWVMALDGAGHGVWDWNVQAGKVFFSRRWKAMLGYAEAQIGKDLSEIRERVHPDDLGAYLQELERHFAQQTPVFRVEYRMRCGDDRYKWILDQGMVFERTPDGTPVRVVGTYTDISAQKKAELELARNHRLVTALLENTSDAYLAIDGDDRVTYFNAAAEALWDIPRSELVGSSLWEALPELASFFYRPFAQARKLQQTVLSDGLYPPLSKYLELRVYPWEEGLWGFFRDISKRKENEEKLERLASTDPLTGVANRSRMVQFCEAEIQRANRYGSGFSVIMFDIDHFKQVNDTHGHAVGDAVLRQVVERIQRVLRRVDRLGRWGGEEFLILMPETDAPGGCAMAERCRSVIAAEPFGEAGSLTISLGVTPYRDGESLDAILERADGGLYAAKRTGRDRVACSEAS